MSGVESQSRVPALTGIKYFQIPTAFLLSSCLAIPSASSPFWNKKMLFPKLFGLDHLSCINTCVNASRHVLGLRGGWEHHWHWCTGDAHGRGCSSVLPTHDLQPGVSWPAEEANRYRGSLLTVSLPCGLSIAPGWQGGKFLLSVFKAPNLWYGFRLQISWSSRKECSPLPLSAIHFCCFCGVQPGERTVAGWINPFGQPQKTNLVEKVNYFYHSEPAGLKHLAPVGYGRDGRDTADGDVAVANHLFSRHPLF